MDRSVYGRFVNSKLLVLESNWDTQNIYPANEPNSFVTKFFSPLEFDGAWEIALAEISYPVYIKNFEKEDLGIYEWPASETVGPDYQKAFESKNVKIYDVTIPTGYYTTAQALGDKLRRELMDTKKQDALLAMLAHTAGSQGGKPPADDSGEQKLFFDYDYQKARGRFRAKNANYAIAASTPDFFKKFGFEPTGQFKPRQDSDSYYMLFIPKKSRLVATAPPELNIYHLMKIYVDCIEETIVANTLTQEIGTVTVPDYSGQISNVFFNLRYVPLNKNRIETIKMECRDTEGALFPLYGGHVHAVFHLRRCQLTI